MVPETTPLLEPRLPTNPPAPWSKALRGRANPSRRVPQTIAHRGYKAKYPENTMKAFCSAVEVGSHAIETDLHLSRDGELVLSHDGTLKRCFGVDKKINECDWAYLKTLQTVKEPHEPMPRLKDLLAFLAEPGMEKVWILIDVKLDDSPDLLLPRLAQVLEDAPTGAGAPWNQRLVVGCWNQTYIDLARKYLPSFPLAVIGYSLMYVRRFLRQPHVNFNMLQKMLVGPLGSRFLRAARAAERAVYVWTVNEEEWMEWSLHKGVDGVITDDPKRFLEVCERWEEADDAAAAIADADAAEPIAAAEAGSDGDAKSPEGADGADMEEAQRERLRWLATRRAGMLRWLGLYAELATMNVLAVLLVPLMMMRGSNAFRVPPDKAGKVLQQI